MQFIDDEGNVHTTMKYQNKQECCYCKRIFTDRELEERYTVKK